MDNVSEQLIRMDLSDTVNMVNVTLTDEGYSNYVSDDVIDLITDLYELYMGHASWAYDSLSARAIFKCNILHGNFTIDNRELFKIDNILNAVHRVFIRLIKNLNIVEILDYLIVGKQLKLVCLVNSRR